MKRHTAGDAVGGVDLEDGQRRVDQEPLIGFRGRRRPAMEMGIGPFGEIEDPMEVGRAAYDLDLAVVEQVIQRLRGGLDGVEPANDPP